MKYLKFRKNKKNWTGKEAGQLFFMGLEEQAAYAKGEKDASEPPEITGELLSKAEEAVPQDEKEQATFAVYRSLYYAIANYYNENSKELNSYSYAATSLGNRLGRVIEREELTRDLENTPLIMTAAEYKNKQNEAIQALRSRKISVYEAFFVILAESTTQRENTPQAIIDALADLERTPVNEEAASLFDDPTITGEQNEREAIARLAGIEPTREAVEAYKRKQRKIAAELLYNGNAREYVKQETGKNLTCTDAELEEMLKYIFEGKIAKSNFVEFSTIEEALKLHTGAPAVNQRPTKREPNKTIYDLISTKLEEAKETDKASETETQREIMAKTSQKWPNLYRAIIDCIREGDTQARNLEEKDYSKPILSISELERNGVPGFNLAAVAERTDLGQFYEKGLIKGSYSDIMRAVKSGVAVAERGGEYLDRALFITYPNILADKDGSKQDARFFEGIFYRAASKIYAFNAALELIAQRFDIPQLEALKIETQNLENWVNGFNENLYRIYALFYGDEKEVAGKRQRMKEIFNPIDFQRTQPTAENMAKTAYYLDAMAGNYGTSYQYSTLRQLVGMLQGI
jgi:hypothetical protein